MTKSDNFFYVNIRDYLAYGDDSVAGEPKLKQLISEFSCPKNPDVDYFLKNNAIEFTKKSQSVTYLVFSLSRKAIIVLRK